MHLITVSNMISTIQNGCLSGAEYVYVRKSRLIIGILDALKKDGYIIGHDEVCEREYHAKVYLKYDQRGIPVIRLIKQKSKASRPIYSGAKSFKTREQFSTLLVSTSSMGVISHIDARKANVGGVLLMEVAA